MVQNKCKICGKEFKAKRRKKQTCSKECFLKLSSILKLGEKNPRFNNGYRQWARIMKDVRRCQNCGRKYKLEVHHKDGNTQNNDLSNLIKVCRRCHMLIDGRLKRFKENSPYVNLGRIHSKTTRENMSKAVKKTWAVRKGGDA